MPDKTLLQQFWHQLNQSASFQAMPPHQQDEIRKSYNEATDEELKLAIEELEKDAAEQETHTKKALIAAQNVQDSLKEIQKEELEANIEQDKTASSEKADELLQQLDEE